MKAVRGRGRATVLGLLAGGAAWLFCCLANAAATEPLRIGSKRFTESYILAEVLAQQASTVSGAASGTVGVEVKAGLGNTAIVYEALRSGAIDLYPEYTGTIAREILGMPDGRSTLPALQAALAPLGLGVGIPLGFQDGYALAMRAPDADRAGIATLADLARHAELRLGLSNEFLGRADGWPGLARHFRLPQSPRALDHGLAYDALGRSQVDVIDIYTTDARIGRLGLRVLQDTDGYFPRYDAVVLYRLGVPERFGAAWAALQQLEGRIDENRMIAMNARAELAGTDFATVARDFLAGRTAETATPAPGDDGQTPSPTGRGLAAKLFGPDLWRLTRQHVVLVASAVALATLLAVPLALLVNTRPRWRAAALGAAGLLQTVPSLALLAVLISVTGVIGTVPALLALTLYAVLPVLRNTATALAEVAPGLRLAGMALGMTTAQRLRLVDLPIALPVILAGMRTATSIAIGTATIAAFIGAGGYGERIVTGLALNDGQLLLAGALPAAALALVSEGLFTFGAWRLARHSGPIS